MSYSYDEDPEEYGRIGEAFYLGIHIAEYAVIFFLDVWEDHILKLPRMASRLAEKALGLAKKIRDLNWSRA